MGKAIFWYKAAPAFVNVSQVEIADALPAFVIVGFWVSQVHLGRLTS